MSRVCDIVVHERLITSASCRSTVAAGENKTAAEVAVFFSLAIKRTSRGRVSSCRTACIVMIITARCQHIIARSVADLLGVYTVRSSDRPVGPTGLSDWSVRRSYHVNASFDWSDRRSDVWFCPTADPTVEACGHYVQLVGPTGQSDNQSRCSVGTCCLRHSYIATAVIYTSGG